MVPWTVLGPGAMGCLWAARLSLSRHPVRLLVPDHYRANLPPVIRFTDLDRQGHELSIPCQFADDSSPIGQLIVCVKSFQVAPAIAAIAHRLTPDSLILLLHNGMGTLDELLPLVPDDCSILQGTMTHGAYRKGRLDSVHTGVGETHIGVVAGTLPPKRLLEVTASLDKALQPVVWHDSIDRALWLKLAINCAINPLTALEACRNGELRAPERLDIVKSVCEESASVLQAQGYEVSGAELFTLVRGVIDSTADNWSSMNRDLHHARQSEIDYITGYLLRQAEQLGLEMPVNHALYEAVKMRESSLVD